MSFLSQHVMRFFAREAKVADVPAPTECEFFLTACTLPSKYSPEPLILKRYAVRRVMNLGHYPWEEE